MRKSIFAAALAAFVTGVAMTTAAFADPEPTAVSTWTGLQAALDAGGSIVLAQDVVATADDGVLAIPTNTTVDLDLNGHVIDCSAMTNHTNWRLSFSDSAVLTLRDGSAAQSGAIVKSAFMVLPTAVLNIYGGTLNGSGTTTSGVMCYGTLNMHGGAITGFGAQYGGGVYIVADGVFNMYGGTITGNTATYGGAVQVINPIKTVNTTSHTGTFHMYGGTISGNTAAEYGGGVSAFNNVSWGGGVISNNTAIAGGGVYLGYKNANRSSYLTNTTIVCNHATNGGGVYIASPSGGTVSARLSSCVVTGNSADENGGGVCAPNNTAYDKYYGSQLYIYGSTIAGNTAGGAGGGVYFDGRNLGIAETVTVSGNTAGGSANNLFLGDGKSIEILSAGVGSGSYVGVSVATIPEFGAEGRTVAHPLSYCGYDTSYLHSDDPRCVINNVAAQNYASIYRAYGVMVSSTGPGMVVANPSSLFESGGTVTITVTPGEDCLLLEGSLRAHYVDEEDVEHEIALAQDANDPQKYTFAMPAGDVTVEATFLHMDTVEFTLTAGRGSGEAIELTVVAGRTHALPPCGFTAPGQEAFAGWLRASDGNVYQPGDSILALEAETFTAQWGQLVVHFDANGGGGFMADADADGNSFTLPACGFAPPSSYCFNGWLVEGSVYQPGDVVGVASNITATAQWAKAYAIGCASSSGGCTFTVTRADTNAAARVRYRTVSQSALAGVHFTYASGLLNFAAGESSKSFAVSERSAGNITDAVDRYIWNDTTRLYRGEVLDATSSEILSSCLRTISYGTGNKLTSSTMFSENSLTVHSGETNVTDKGFGQAYHAIPIASYFSATAPQDYFKGIGAQLRMTMDFQAKEVSDGYQYIQMLVDKPYIANTVNYDNSNDNGNPGTPNQSRYLACFTIEGKGVDTYYKYSFPVTSQSSGCGYVAHPWNGLGNSVGNLEQQNFKSGSRASDGKLIVPVDAQTVGVRFDASGSDNDDWKLKSLKAYFTAVDGTRPCVMSVSAASGLYGYRDKVTICLQFSEIVKVNSAPTLNTNFGSFSYDGGSGTSVLYFSRTMNNTALGAITGGLTINSISYSSTGIQDLAGNYYEGKYRNLNTSLSAVNLPDVNYEGRGLLQMYGLDGSTHTDNFMRLNATYMFPAYTGQLPEGKEFDCYMVGNTAYRPGDAIVVNQDYAAYPQFKWRKYPIVFKNYDGTVLQDTEFEHTSTPVYTNATPTKPSTAQYTFHFAGWEPAIETVTGNATYTAQYTNTVNSYTVTWIDGNDSELKTDTLEYGQTPDYVGATPTKAATAQYTYHFAGWAPAIETVTSNATYFAQFTNTVNKYAITWKGDGDNELATYQVPYGDTPAYTNATPVKAATAQYTYHFSGWEPEIETVTSNATYTAQFTNTVNKYAVTWIDGNGGELKTDTLEYGQTPSYVGDTPTKAATPKYTYAFDGTWTPAIEPVTSNAIYTAQFGSTVNEYAITWIDGDGNELATYQVPYDETPAYTNATPTKTATAQYTYYFVGWDPAVESVTGNATYFAQFTNTVNRYTITWKGDGDNELATYQVPYGETPAYTNATPAKPATAQYTYYFAGWEPAIETVTGNATYVAQFTNTVNRYAVTWLDEDGSVLATYQVPYGETPVYTNATPVKATDATNAYVFAGWTPEVAPVSTSAAYMATFSAVSLWQDLAGKLAAGGTVVLSNDVVATSADSALTVPAGVSATLDLNGHVVDRALVQAADNGEAIRVLGSLTLTNSVPGSGAITGGNTTQCGGGVRVVSNGCFTMNGGAITGNSAALRGGGVFLEDAQSRFLVSGAPRVVGNVAAGLADAAASDIEFGSAESLVEVVGPLAPEALLGIVPDVRRAVTTNLGGNGGLANFFSDNDEYTLALDADGEACIVPPTYALTYVPQDHVTVSVYSTTSDVSTAAGFSDIVIVPTNFASAFSPGEWFALRFDFDPGWFLDLGDWNFVRIVADGSGEDALGDGYEFFVDGTSLYLFCRGPSAPATLTVALAPFSRTVTFQNHDGTELQSGPVGYGVQPAYTNATPTRAAPDGDHYYAFTGWTPALAPVVVDIGSENLYGTIVYTATYELHEVEKFAVVVDPNVAHGEVGVNVVSCDNGQTYSQGPYTGPVPAGTRISISYIPDPGYGFVSWSVVDTNGVPVEVGEDGEFTMPASDVTVSATFAALLPVSVEVDEAAQDAVYFWSCSVGGVEMDPPAAAPGTAVNLTVFMSSLLSKPTAVVATTNGVAVPSSIECPGETYPGWYVLFTMPSEPVVVSLSAVPATFEELVLLPATNTVDAAARTFSFVPEENGVYRFAMDGSFLFVYDCHDEIILEGNDEMSGALLAGETYCVCVHAGGWNGTPRPLVAERTGDATLYSVSADPDIVGGTVEPSVTNAPEGHVVCLTPVPAPGYAYVEDSLRYVYGGTTNPILNVAYDGRPCFRMPAADVAVSAEFEPRRYAVVVDPAIEHGTVDVRVVTAEYGSVGFDTMSYAGPVPAGTRILLSASHDPGYGFVSWSVVDTNGVPVGVDEYGRFTMPSSDVTVSAVFAELQPVVVESDWATSNRVDNLYLYASGDWMYNLDDYVAAPGGTVDLYVDMGPFAFAPTATVATASGAAVVCEVVCLDEAYCEWSVRFTMPDEPVVITLSTVLVDYPALSLGENGVSTNRAYFTFTPATPGRYSFTAAGGDAYCGVCNEAGSCLMSDNDGCVTLDNGVRYYVEYCDYGESTDRSISVTLVEEMFSVTVDPDMQNGEVEVLVVNYEDEHGSYGTSQYTGPVFAGTIIEFVAYPYSGYGLDSWSVVDTNGVPVAVDKWGHYIMPASDVTVSAVFAEALPVVVQSDVATSNMVNSLSLRANGVWGYYPDDFAAAPGATVDLWFGINSFFASPTATVATASGAVVASNVEYLDGDGGGWSVRFTMPDEPVVITLATVPRDYPALSLGDNGVSTNRAFFTFTPETTGYYAFDLSEGGFVFVIDYDGNMAGSLPLVAGRRYYVYFYGNGNAEAHVITVTKTADVTVYSAFVDQNIEHGAVVLKTTNTWSICNTPVPAGTGMYLQASPDLGYALATLSVVDGSGAPVEVDESGYFTMPASDVTVSATFARAKFITVETDEVAQNRINYWYCYANGIQMAPAAAAPGADVKLYVYTKSFVFAPTATVATASGAAIACAECYDEYNDCWFIRFTMPSERVVVALSAGPADYLALHEGTNAVDVSWNCFTFTPTTTGYYSFAAADGDYVGVYDSFGSWAADNPLLAGERYFVSYYADGDEGHDIVVTKTSDATTYAVAVDPSITGGTVTPSVLRAAEGNIVYLTVAEDADTILGTLRATWTNGAEAVELEIETGDYGDKYFTMPAGDVTVTAEFPRARPLTVVANAKASLYYIEANGTYYETTPVKVATGTNVVVWIWCSIGYEPRASAATAAGEPVDSECVEEYGCWCLTFTMPDEPVVVTASSVRANIPALVVGDNAVDAAGKLFSFTPAETAEYRFSAEGGRLEVFDDQGSFFGSSWDVLSIALVGGKTYFVDYSYQSYWDGTAKNLLVEKLGRTVKLYDVVVDPGIEGGTVETSVTNAPQGHFVYLRPVPAPGYAYVEGSLVVNLGSRYEALNDYGDGTFCFEMYSANATVTAEFEPLPFAFPRYLDEADDLVKSNYVAWAAQYGADTASVYETAFLLGIDPATAIPDGAALLKVVDFAITNKVLHLELASDVCNLFQPAGLSGTPALCNGVLTLELAFDLGASSPSGFGIGTFAVPVTIDASGHAVIDIEFTSSNMPAALFLRPAIGFKIVNFAE